MEAEKVLEILKRVRHDLGNHLQVISGYLDLGYLDEIRNYIDEVTRYMQYEKWLFASAEPEIALYLYYQMLRGEELGAVIRYKDIKVHDLRIIEKTDEPYATISGWCGKLNHKDDAVFEVVLVQKGKEVEMRIKTGTDEITRVLKE
ncbi:Spo0B domain-containing protein [Thermosyntropha lipolytica]|uniref:Spo0B domain-containing protein n=1 Tax=Thermosyntropha lipolytica TaxID=54294 RepID=UPI0009345C9B|nr:Spo0B domain-containing protein [Thermosyntropha lipolytica]